MTPAPEAPLPLLVVEDDIATLEYIEFLLTSAGYTVRGAANGAAALRLSSQERFGVVLVDRRLPDMDGLDVVRALVSQHGSQVALIMMTADRDPTLQERALAAGVRSFLPKPFLPDDLLALLPAPPQPPREHAACGRDWTKVSPEYSLRSN